MFGSSACVCAEHMLLHCHRHHRFLSSLHVPIACLWLDALRGTMPANSDLIVVGRDEAKILLACSQVIDWLRVGAVTWRIATRQAVCGETASMSDCCCSHTAGGVMLSSDIFELRKSEVV
eukprot:813823-Amphidinium_carterae.1